MVAGSGREMGCLFIPGKEITVALAPLQPRVSRSGQFLLTVDEPRDRGRGTASGSTSVPPEEMPLKDV
jgi:hypothetical protein